MSLSFKKFIEFVEIEGDVSDEQINEIFGMFKNNQKIEKLRKEREKLKNMSSEKKAELDQALKDFAAGRKTPVTDRVKGALKDVDWDEVLSPEDRKYQAKNDRRMATEAKSDVEHALKMVKAAGFPYKGKTLDALRKEHAKELLSNDYHDQWHMRVSDALGMSRMNKDALETLAEAVDPALKRAKDLIKTAGFGYKGKTLDALRKEHAKTLLGSDYHDQWHMRVSDALGMTRMNKDALEKIAEAKANVKAFKVEVPKDTTDQQIYDFIEDQSVVTIEHFDRKGNIVYFYPHFEHDYDPHMTGVMQAAFNRFIKHK